MIPENFQGNPHKPHDFHYSESGEILSFPVPCLHSTLIGNTGIARMPEKYRCPYVQNSRCRFIIGVLIVSKTFFKIFRPEYY